MCRSQASGSRDVGRDLVCVGCLICYLRIIAVSDARSVRIKNTHLVQRTLKAAWPFEGK